MMNSFCAHRNHLSDGDLDPPTGRDIFGGHTWACPQSIYSTLFTGAAHLMQPLVWFIAHLGQNIVLIKVKSGTEEQTIGNLPLLTAS